MGLPLLPTVRDFGRQLFLALRVLRRAGLIHCDVKPENLLPGMLILRSYIFPPHFVVVFRVSVLRRVTEATWRRQHHNQAE